MKTLFFVPGIVILLFSCGSNALTQQLSERTIRKFMTENPVANASVDLSENAINKIAPNNIYSQHNTSVRVHFAGKPGNKNIVLLFDFTRAHGGGWSLTAVENTDKESDPDLATWLSNKKKLKIPVQ